MVDKIWFLQEHPVDKNQIMQGLNVRLTPPSHYYEELSDARLGVIAQALLDIRHETLLVMTSPYDDNYTKEGAIFGRSRNMLIELSLSNQYDWLRLAHAGPDVTFDIGAVPCRYFRDDPEKPGKAGFFKRNAADGLFAADGSAPVMWRFVVERALSEDDEDQVYLLGFNVFQEKVSEWVYGHTSRVPHSVDGNVPAATQIAPAKVDLFDDELDVGTPAPKTGTE